MALALAELLHELPRLRREFEVARQLAAQAVDRAKRLTAQSEVSRRIRFNAAREPPSMVALRDSFPAETEAGLERLSALIDAALDYSRLSVHFRASQSRTVDMNEIVRAAVTAMETPAAQTGLQLRARVAKRPAFVTGDPERLRQAVINLVQNAVRFTPAQGRIDVTVDVADPNVSIAVEDTGEGIAAERLQGIFEPFGGKSGSLPGLGIGLALVRRIAEMHGGTVSAASHGAGRGSIFTLHLPIADRVVEP